MIIYPFVETLVVRNSIIHLAIDYNLLIQSNKKIGSYLA